MSIYACPKHGTSHRACKCFTQGAFYQYLEKFQKEPKLADALNAPKPRENKPPEVRINVQP